MKRLLPLLLGTLLLASCSITQPVSATSNPVGSKVGKASGKCYFGMCINVDASILTACQNGNITEISTVDYRTRNFLGVLQIHECIVTGE